LSDIDALRIHREPKLKSSAMLVGWSEDAGRLGPRVIDHLCKTMGCEEFAQIEPAGFFQLTGVSIEEDVAQFPDSKFYCCEDKSLVLFKSSPPRADWHRFITTVLQVAEQYCHVKELYTIGAMVYFGAHTAPRQLLAIANSPQIKEALGPYSLARGMNYETPPGQRPTLGAYLQWACKSRDIIGASIWVPIPFYLVATEDPRGCRKMLEFLDSRLGLDFDFTALDRDIARQDEKIAEVRLRFPDIDDSIRKLEGNLGLTQEENEKLVGEIGDFLKRRD
jgi:predicted ATP-grasp superfamily ATP-dependent carboligase